jgi:hypothetical protein
VYAYLFFLPRWNGGAFQGSGDSLTVSLLRPVSRRETKPMSSARHGDANIRITTDMYYRDPIFESASENPDLGLRSHIWATSSFPNEHVRTSTEFHRHPTHIAPDTQTHTHYYDYTAEVDSGTHPRNWIPRASLDPS